jgi:hypothetical protein
MKQAVLAAVLVLGACGTGAETVDQVVADYLRARGGAERLRGVQTLRMTGRVVLPGIEAPLVLELKRPGKVRTEFTVEGRQSVRAWDGQVAWVLPPVPGASPQPVPPDQADELKAQADVDLSPLVNTEAKGLTVDLAGRESLPGGDTWKLVVLGGGRPARSLFVDVTSHLVVRTEEVRTVEGREVPFVTEVTDYRTVDGLVYPYRLRSGPRDDPEAWQTVEIERIDVNPPLDDAGFSPPNAAPSP